MSPIARLLRLVSIIVCLIVITSFAIFAFDQTRSASSRQQEAVNGGVAATATASARPASGSSAHESSLHSTIDDISNRLTSPFKALTSGSSSEWVVHGVNLLLALLIYGFGLGFLARVIRVRV